jgi:hypothetical protein
MAILAVWVSLHARPLYFFHQPLMRSRPNDLTCGELFSAPFFFKNSNPLGCLYQPLLRKAPGF